MERTAPVLGAILALILPACAASSVKLAQECLEQGKTAEAKNILHAEVQENPDNGKALLMLGILAMQEEEFESAHDYFDKAKECSKSIARDIESHYGPFLEYLESIVWVHIRTSPSILGLQIARFPEPLIVEDILEVKEGWSNISYRNWMPNSEDLEHYKQLLMIKVLFETPEMAYVEINGWAPTDQVKLKSYMPQQQGVHLEIDVLNSVPTKDGGKILVFGTVTNRGSITARNPRAIVTAMTLNLTTGMMGYSTALGDPMGPPPPMVMDYLYRNFIDIGEATVPIRPQNLGPGETGIIVLTIEVPDAGAFFVYRAELEYDPFG